jgi:hypothetical protein
LRDFAFNKNSVDLKALYKLEHLEEDIIDLETDSLINAEMNRDSNHPKTDNSATGANLDEVDDDNES